MKPENLLIGIENNTNKIYMIDFGLSKSYKNSKKEHISYKENKSLTGTARWASINNHLGIEQSRRDDLESLGYILIFLLISSLPWQGHNASNRNLKYKKIMESKMATPIEVLCKDLPEEICMYLNYSKCLKFNEKPDYDYLKELFFTMLNMYYPEEDEFDFEWNRIEEDVDVNGVFHNLKKQNSILKNDSVINSTDNSQDMTLDQDELEEYNMNGNMGNNGNRNIDGNTPNHNKDSERDMEIFKEIGKYYETGKK